MMLMSPEILWGFGLVVLALALAWGVYQSKRRNRRLDPIADEATRQMYKDPAQPK